MKKLERYLTGGHGLDLKNDDVTDHILDNLDGFAYRWFDTLHRPFPYLFSRFDRDLRARYVPADYQTQLLDQYESTKQGDRAFDDYHTELCDFEAMLGDVKKREKMRVLKRGLHDDLKKAMLVHEGLDYDEFVSKASRIDQVLIKNRKKDKTQPTTVSKEPKEGTWRDQQSNQRFRRSSSSYQHSARPKESVKELKPEISRQEADRLGLCRHCKESGHFRRECPRLHSRKPAMNAISVMPSSHPDQAKQDQPQIPTVNKVRQGYAVKDARTYREALVGKPANPRLEAPSWSVSASNIPNQTGHHDQPRLEEPFVANVLINNVKARRLIDTGASGDFVSSHFAYVNRVKHRKLGSSIPIQQAVKESKPKCNAIANVSLQFGDWRKNASMYVIHLAHYDAIIGIPTLMDGGATFDLRKKILHLSGFDTSIPLERYKAPVRRPNARSSTQTKVPTKAPTGARRLAISAPQINASSVSSSPADPPPLVDIDENDGDLASLSSLSEIPLYTADEDSPSTPAVLVNTVKVE